ncbi:Flagellum site-determining protein YlxH [Sporomusa rhizae]|uniref:MinD/ParA family protein n=1 Tax=Sporomusa rhizae TaxID=357999 RepID=UPI00352A824C
MCDQAEKLRQMTLKSSIPKSPIIKQTPKSRVITVTSGKGGVGKTNFTVNLALALAALEQKVLVIDADLGMANVEVILGCSAPYNILNLLEDGLNISDVVTEGPRGIKFMAGGSGIYQLANLSDANLKHIIAQISLFDNWADFILIDTGAGLSRNVLNFVMAADEVIIITTPEPTAITDAYAMMKAYAGQSGQAPLRLVVNRILDRDEGQLVVDKLMRVSQRFLDLSINSLGYVYEDRKMVKAVKNQIPLLVSFPDAISSRCIESIAQRMLYGENIQQPRGMRGFFHKFLEYMY